MPLLLQNKLLNYEVMPPASAWMNIASQLDEEFVASDAALSDSLSEMSVQPPARVWSAIDQELSAAPVIEMPLKKLIPLRRLAIAATLIGALVIGSLYFLNSSPPTSTVQEAGFLPRQIPLQPMTSSPQIIDSAIRPARILAAAKPSVPVRQRNSDEASPATEEISDRSEIELKPVRMISALQPVEVPVQPIRDDRGNIIMDMSVIVHPDDPYITVTGPNGSQTRISNKFLHCLTYLNTSFASTDAGSEGIECHTKFAQWKDKLLNEGGYVPSANNFFDIFELKELIQER